MALKGEAQEFNAKDQGGKIGVAINYEKVGYDIDKNAYIITERDNGQLLCTYTAYPDFARGVFICYPRSLPRGERPKGIKRIDMCVVETRTFTERKN